MLGYLGKNVFKNINGICSSHKFKDVILVLGGKKNQHVFLYLQDFVNRLFGEEVGTKSTHSSLFIKKLPKFESRSYFYNFLSSF